MTKIKLKMACNIMVGLQSSNWFNIALLCMIFFYFKHNLKGKSEKEKNRGVGKELKYHKVASFDEIYFMYYRYSERFGNI